jgi:hypothetical protein
METDYLHGLEILVDEEAHALVCEEHMKFVKDNYGRAVGPCPHNDTNCFVKGCGKVATHCVEVPETWERS